MHKLGWCFGNRVLHSCIKQIREPWSKSEFYTQSISCQLKKFRKLQAKGKQAFVCWLVPPKLAFLKALHGHSHQCEGPVLSDKGEADRAIANGKQPFSRLSSPLCNSPQSFPSGFRCQQEFQQNFLWFWIMLKYCHSLRQFRRTSNPATHPLGWRQRWEDNWK